MGVVLLACTIASAAQTQSTPPSPLLDHLAGTWVLKGTIAGKQTTHDVQADWVLRHEYLQIHEISREKDSAGKPAYEAIVTIGWDPKVANQYVCLWLDSTSGKGLTSEGFGRGNPSGDAIPFVFTISPTNLVHTTFTYRKGTDTWQWLIDEVENGKTDRFADVELTRTK